MSIPPEPRTLAPFYRGWGDYQHLLIDAIAPLSPDQLALHASPGQRPLWLLLAHVIATRIGWFQWMGEGVGDPTLVEMELWDADGAPPRTAEELIHGLAVTWALIDACLNRWTPDMLADAFTRERPRGLVTRTRQWIVWHVLEHDLHHGGEISLTLGNHGLAAPDL
jgi:uncharacterized damage-inducible protein DinB